MTEAVVLAELRAVCGAADRPLPSRFEWIFEGSDEAGWFALFVRATADRVAGADPEFAAVGNAEQVARIRSLVAAAQATALGSDNSVR